MSNVSDCPFCSDDDAIVKNELAYARFDKYPVNPGHVPIIPRRHVASFFETSRSERQEMLNLVDEMKLFLDRQYSPDGYNIGVNVGETSGQTKRMAGMMLLMQAGPCRSARYPEHQATIIFRESCTLNSGLVTEACHPAGRPGRRLIDWRRWISGTRNRHQADGQRTNE